MAKPPRLTLSDTQMSLDEQIALAEMQVIVRDARIRRRADLLVCRVKHEAIKHVGGGALLGLGIIVLMWWLNRLARKNMLSSEVAAVPKELSHTFEYLFRDAGIMMAGLLPLLWLMLPRAWWRSVTSGIASIVLTFIAPLLGCLFRCRAVSARSG